MIYHLHQGVVNGGFKLQGFHDNIRKDRAEGQGGGVAVYVRENIANKRL